MTATASFTCRNLSPPQFIRGLDKEVKWPFGRQLVVEVELKNVDKIEWYLDDRLLKSCEELFRDGQLHEGGADGGVQIVDHLCADGEGFSRLLLPEALQQSSDRAFLRVCAFAEFDTIENAGQIRVVSAREMSRTAMPKSKRWTIGADVIGTEIEQPKQRQMVAMDKETAEELAKRQTKWGNGTSHWSANNRRTIGNIIELEESYEVLDRGNAFHPTPLAVKENIRRTSNNDGQFYHNLPAQIPAVVECLAEVQPMASCQMNARNKKSATSHSSLFNQQQRAIASVSSMSVSSSATNGPQQQKGESGDAHCCVLCPGVFSSPKGLNIHRALKHFACGMCDHLAHSSEALKEHKKETHCTRRSLAAANVHKAQEKAPPKRRESAALSNRLTLRGMHEQFEQFKDQHKDEMERMDRNLNAKIDDLRRDFERANLDEQQTVEKSEQIEEAFLSEDDAKD